MNNLYNLIDLGLDDRFVCSKDVNKKNGNIYLLDLKYNNIMKFLSEDSIKLIKKVGDDDLVIINIDDNEKDKCMFRHVRMTNNGIVDIYNNSFDNDSNLYPREINLKGTNTFIMNRNKGKSSAYNSDKEIEIDADRIEKKTISYNGEKKEVLCCTNYIRKGNVFDMVKFYASADSLEVKGFYSRLIDKIKFYFDSTNNDIKGFSLNVLDINNPDDDATFIRMYDDNDLKNDDDYKKINKENKREKYRFNKTYENEIIKYINMMHQIEKVDSDNDERKAEKILSKKYFE